ncbi:hypothetical protein KP729_003679|nr:hypothetical protein [Delftia acidovorans]
MCIGVAGMQHAAQQVVAIGGGSSVSITCRVAAHVDLGDKAAQHIPAKQRALGQGCVGPWIVGRIRGQVGIALVQFGQFAGGVVAVALYAAVKTGFLDQVVCGVVGEAGDGAVFVLQGDEPAHGVIAVAQRAAQRIAALHGLVQAVVGVAGDGALRVGVGKQVALGVVGIVMFGTISAPHPAQASKRVVKVARGLAQGVGGGHEVAQYVPRIARDLARAVGVGHELSGFVPLQMAGFAQRVFYGDGQAARVVFPARGVAERVQALDQVALGVVGLTPGMAQRVGDFFGQVELVVFEAGGGT